MAWLNTSGSDNQANYVLVSKDAEVVCLRDEYIPVGYYLKTWQLDENGHRVVDDSGEYVYVTEWHQTGTVNIKCKVQKVVTVEEWRAVSESVASNLTGGALGGVTVSENLQGHTWQSQGGAWCEVPNCIGTVVRVSSRRANEAGAWTVTKTTTVTTAV